MRSVSVIRKPLSHTIALNAIYTGAGGIGVDVCRIGDFKNTTPSGVDRRNAKLFVLGYRPGTYQVGQKTPDTPEGRWPSNVIRLCAPDVSGRFPDVKTGGPGITKKNDSSVAYPGSASSQDRETIGYNDNGSAAHFFYSTKGLQ